MVIVLVLVLLLLVGLGGLRPSAVAMGRMSMVAGGGREWQMRQWLVVCGRALGDHCIK